MNRFRLAFLCVAWHTVLVVLAVCSGTYAVIIFKLIDFPIGLLYFRGDWPSGGAGLALPIILMGGLQWFVWGIVIQLLVNWWWRDK
jgi:hypothetical protein